MAASGQMTQAPSTPTVPTLPIAGLGLRIVAFILDCIVVFGCVMLFFALGFLQAALQGDDPPDWSIWLGLGVTAPRCSRWRRSCSSSCGPGAARAWGKWR
jgi:hypothetical protein